MMLGTASGPMNELLHYRPCINSRKVLSTCYLFSAACICSHLDEVNKCI